jgi:hypothetical protein
MGAFGFGGEGRFQNGTEGGIPPMFFDVRESGFESMVCGRTGNECVQAVEKKGFRWGCFSKRRGDFTEQYSVRESTCQ